MLSLFFSERADRGIQVILITRKFNFSASHKLFNPNLSEEENLRLYGKCSNPNGHGHNYTMEVTVAGEINTETGYLMDLSLLKKLVNDAIINIVDHKNLNVDVVFLSNIIPTTENIAGKFWDILSEKINSAEIKLYSIKLTETENNIVEIRK